MPANCPIIYRKDKKGAVPCPKFNNADSVIDKNKSDDATIIIRLTYFIGMTTELKIVISSFLLSKAEKSNMFEHTFLLTSALTQQAI